MGWLAPSRPRRRRAPVIRRATRPVRPAPPCVDCGATVQRKPGPGRAPLRCAACRAKAAGTVKWRLAPGALEKVGRHFGLEHPLHVRRSTGRRQRGCYKGIHFGSAISKQLDPHRRYHVIQISSALAPAEASRVLLHEGCHARQRERDAMAHLRAHRQIRAHGDPRTSAAGQRAYRDHPIEVEARAAESAAAALAPLIVPG